MMGMTRRIALAAAVLGTVAGGAGEARADLVTFDFEGLAATAPPPGGALASLVLTEPGLTLTLTREGGQRFDIFNNALSPFPASYGTRSLDPFSGVTSPTAIIGTFSSAVDGVSIDLGDFGDDADNLLLEAFSGLGGTGTLLASATGTLPGGGFAFTGTTLSVTATGISSIRFIGGLPPGANSVFYDNITANVTAVPEASSIAMGGLVVLAGLGHAWRRRKRASA
jgi:hypothetical protein